MTNEIKYLNLGSLTPDIYSSVWEYGNLIDINCPIVIVIKDLILLFNLPKRKEHVRSAY